MQQRRDDSNVLGTMGANEILGELDSAAVQYRFGQLDHPYRYLITARLHAYTDAERWVLLIETVGYDPRAAAVVNVLQPVGNCLLQDKPKFLYRINNMTDLFDKGADWAYTYRQVPII